VKDGVNDVAVAVITWRYLVSPKFILTSGSQRMATRRETSTGTASSCIAVDAAT
jgi:hypothetical protein